MFKTVLLPVDLGEKSSWEKALPAAVSQVRLDGGSLHVFTVLPDLGLEIVGAYLPPDFAEQSIAAAESELATFCAANVPADVACVQAVRRGAIYHEIMSYADDTQCDLIVMASHRPDLSDYLLGPNAARVVRHAGQSVLVVRD